MENIQEVKQLFAKKYPKFVVTDKKTGKKDFNIAALMRSKGHIK